MKTMKIGFQSNSKEIFVYGKTRNQAHHNAVNLINHFFQENWKTINSPQICEDGYKVKVELK